MSVLNDHCDSLGLVRMTRAAKVLGVDHDRLKSWVRAGAVKSVRVDWRGQRLHCIPSAEVERLHVAMNEHTTHP